MKIKINGKMRECRKVKNGQLVLTTDYGLRDDGSAYQLFGVGNRFRMNKDTSTIYRLNKKTKIQKKTKLIPHKFSTVKPVRAWGIVKDGKLLTEVFPHRVSGYKLMGEKCVRVLVSVA